MILRKLQSNPAAMIPAAMTLAAAGMSILTIGIMWPRFSASLPQLGTDWNDFFRGMPFGIAMALEAGGAVLAVAAGKRRKAL